MQVDPLLIERDFFPGLAVRRRGKSGQQSANNQISCTMNHNGYSAVKIQPDAGLFQFHRLAEITPRIDFQYLGIFRHDPIFPIRRRSIPLNPHIAEDQFRRIGNMDHRRGTDIRKLSIAHTFAFLDIFASTIFQIYPGKSDILNVASAVAFNKARPTDGTVQIAEMNPPDG